MYMVKANHPTYGYYYEGVKKRKEFDDKLQALERTEKDFVKTAVLRKLGLCERTSLSRVREDLNNWKIWGMNTKKRMDTMEQVIDNEHLEIAKIDREIQQNRDERKQLYGDIFKDNFKQKNEMVTVIESDIKASPSASKHILLNPVEG